MIKKICILLVSCCFLAGCWDRQEINDVAFVSGTAIDLIEDKQIRESIQIPLPGQMGGAGSEGGGGGTSGGKPYYIESEVASSIREASNELQNRLSRKLNFSHRRIILLGEELARSGISEYVDVFSRVPQNRLTAFVYATKGPALDVLSADIQLEQTSAEMIKEIVNFNMTNSVSLKDLTNLLLLEGVDPILPVIELRKLPGEKEKETVELNGLAIFSNEGKLVGILEEEDSKSILMVLNQIAKPEIEITPPKGEGDINILFTKIEAETEPKIHGDTVRMVINIQAKGGLAENESSFDTTVKDNLRELEKVAENKIEEEIKKTVSKLQKDYSSGDPLGFGNKIYLSNPRFWKDIKDQWYEKYPEVAVEVNAAVHIENTGALTDPFGVKERKQDDG